MNDLWLKIKVWTKIGVFVLALVYLLMFILQNSGQPLDVWVWFGHILRTSLLQMIPSLLLAGVVGTLMVRMAFRTVKQIRQLRSNTATVQAQKDLADLKAKADMLQTKPVAAPQEPEHPPASS